MSYSNGPSGAYGQIKNLISRTVFTEINACMQNEVEAQYICSKTEDHYNAVTAFCEKKKPVFQGK